MQRRGFSTGMRSDNSTLDDYGTVVAKPRAVGRALMQWMKGRARIRASGMMKGRCSSRRWLEDGLT